MDFSDRLQYDDNRLQCDKNRIGDELTLQEELQSICNSSLGSTRKFCKLQCDGKWISVTGFSAMAIGFTATKATLVTNLHFRRSFSLFATLH
jgi:hypothetical protein